MFVGKLERDRGAAAVEAAVAMPIVFIFLFATFAIAQSFFVGSKLVHLTTSAAISLRAVGQAGEQITYNPAYTQLIHSLDASAKSAQVDWYDRLNNTGINKTNDLHLMFMNLFLGSLVRIYPDAMSPPQVVSGVVNHEKAVEVRLEAAGDDTIIQVRSTPTLLKMFNKIIGFGAVNPIVSAGSTINRMNLADATTTDVDDTYVDAAANTIPVTILNPTTGTTTTASEPSSTVLNNLSLTAPASPKVPAGGSGPQFAGAGVKP